jgi:hypothetical protein
VIGGVDDLCAVPQRDRKPHRGRRSDHAAAERQILHETVAELAVAWQIDADSAQCGLAQVARVGPQRERALVGEDALLVERPDGLAAYLLGVAGAEAPIHLELTGPVIPKVAKAGQQGAQIASARDVATRDDALGRVSTDTMLHLEHKCATIEHLIKDPVVIRIVDRDHVSPAVKHHLDEHDALKRLLDRGAREPDPVGDLAAQTLHPYGRRGPAVALRPTDLDPRTLLRGERIRARAVSPVRVGERSSNGGGRARGELQSLRYLVHSSSPRSRSLASVIVA